MTFDAEDPKEKGDGSMTTRYGYSQSDWDKAKAEMKQILVERAKVRGMIPYSDLANRIQTIRIEPDSYAMAAMLGNFQRRRFRRARYAHSNRRSQRW